MFATITKLVHGTSQKPFYITIPSSAPPFKYLWGICTARSRPANRRLKNVVLVLFNKCQNEASFLKIHHKVKNDTSSISKKCTSTDRQRPAIDPNFFCQCISLREDCLFSEQTGVFLSETDSKRFLDSDESVCCSLLQRDMKILVPRNKVSGRSWWNTRRILRFCSHENTAKTRDVGGEEQ